MIHFLFSHINRVEFHILMNYSLMVKYKVNFIDDKIYIRKKFSQKTYY